MEDIDAGLGALDRVRRLAEPGAPDVAHQEEGPKSRRSMVNGAGGWITSRE